MSRAARSYIKPMALRNKTVSMGQRPLRRGACFAVGEGGSVDLAALGELISSGPLDAEQKSGLERIAKALDIPLNTAKELAFKKRAVLSMDAGEIQDKVKLVAQIVDVPFEQARQMVVIQPGLLFDTTKQAEALQYGIRAISYELNAPKEEVVDLILKNQSVLHGREMHLSVADIAHLAMLREPKGRIVD